MDSQVTVSVNCKTPWAILSLHNQGLGFPKAGADGLIERFVRGDNVASIVASALGLTTAEEAVRAYGGRLSISNNADGVGVCVSGSFFLC